MQVNDLFESTLSLLSEGIADKSGYDADVIIRMINILIPEIFRLNNQIRVKRDKPELIEIPEVFTMEDELELEPEIARNVLPYGLAAKIALDDDLNKASFFDQMYSIRATYYQTIVPEDTENIYGDDREEY